MPHLDDKTLTHLLDALDQAAKGQKTSVQDVLHKVSDRSFDDRGASCFGARTPPVAEIPAGADGEIRTSEQYSC